MRKPFFSQALPSFSAPKRQGTELHLPNSDNDFISSTFPLSCPNFFERNLSSDQAKMSQPWSKIGDLRPPPSSGPATEAEESAVPVQAEYEKRDLDGPVADFLRWIATV